MELTFGLWDGMAVAIATALALVAVLDPAPAEFVRRLRGRISVPRSRARSGVPAPPPPRFEALADLYPLLSARATRTLYEHFGYLGPGGAGATLTPVQRGEHGVVRVRDVAEDARPPRERADQVLLRALSALGLVLAVLLFVLIV